MSGSKEPRDKGEVELKDEVVTDYIYFTGQKTYWTTPDKHRKTIQIPRTKASMDMP